MGMIFRFFGADADWERPEPTPEQRRADLRLAIGWFVMIALGTEFIRGAGDLPTDPRSVIEQYIAIVIVSALVIWRRRFPLTVGFLIVMHLFVSQYLVGAVALTLPIQVLYFFGLYSAVAWGRDRQLTVYTCGVLFLVLFGWFTYAFAISNDAAIALEESGVGRVSGALFSPLVSVALYTMLSNLIFFVGGVVLGQFAWNGARSTAKVISQAQTISQQSDRLREQAVIDERLRIARELHDVVAHHISAMGVQAAAAKRVLARDPEAATVALNAVETSSREAVNQMRALLGALRAGEEANRGGPPQQGDPRAPQPSLAAIPDLVRESSTEMLQVDYALVEDVEGATGRVPMPIQLSAYRIVQESLANVRKHSTATHVSVVVRSQGHLEVEIVDNGRPRRGTSGSGLGQLGTRERAQHHDGMVEIGPRYGGGYRVRVRFAARALAPGAQLIDHGGNGSE